MLHTPSLIPCLPHHLVKTEGFNSLKSSQEYPADLERDKEIRASKYSEEESESELNPFKCVYSWLNSKAANKRPMYYVCPFIKSIK